MTNDHKISVGGFFFRSLWSIICLQTKDAQILLRLDNLFYCELILFLYPGTCLTRTKKYCHIYMNDCILYKMISETFYDMK